MFQSSFQQSQVAQSIRVHLKHFLPWPARLEKLYSQDYKDNSLYDIKMNPILKNFDGIAIVKDGFVLYKNGDTLKLASVEEPYTALREAKTDYIMVRFEHALNEDIIHVKKGDSVTFKTYSSILKEFQNIEELFTKEEDH